MGLIGRGWKPCEGWSRPVLIGRGLAHNSLVVRIHCVTLSTQPCPPPVFGFIPRVGGVGVVCSAGARDKRILLSVVVAEWGTPGPIPNPEAKPSSADGTALVRVWESRSSPTFNMSEEPRQGNLAGLNSFPGLFAPPVSVREHQHAVITAVRPAGPAVCPVASILVVW